MGVRNFVSVWNVPGWGILLMMSVTLIKTWPIIQRNVFEARDKRESRYGTRIRDLEASVEECRRECDEHKEELRKEVRTLEDRLMGLRRQHVQEQISLIAAIVDSVDNPMLKQLLATLQSVQHALPQVKPLGNVIGDAAKTPS